jgi:hypothetical protein
MYATELAGLGHFSVLAAFSNIHNLCQGRHFLPTFFARICKHLPAFANLFNPTITNTSANLNQHHTVSSLSSHLDMKHFCGI